MDEFVLVRPTEKYAEEISAYRQEFLETDSDMDGCGSLKKISNPLEWIADRERKSKKETCPEGLAVAAQFLYIRQSDNRLVGMIQVRHELNDFLEKYSGHIGYSIRPSERRKGYAKRMLSDALIYCKEIGLDKVMVSCSENNQASRKTILANGGKYESTIFEPNEKIFLEKYWIDLSGTSESKLLLITGDIAAGKSTFSKILSARYRVAAFQKDSIKEILGDSIGFCDREENLKLSDAAMGVLYHLFCRLAVTGSGVILEANFHEAELHKLHEIAEENHYAVCTLVLRGDTDVLYQRYRNRMNNENRHPVHLSTTLDVKADFVRCAERYKKEKIIGDTIEIDATDFSYQEDEDLLKRIDGFMCDKSLQNR